MDKPELIQQAPLRTPIIRADGVNDSERYLKRLCERSFLSLWSYAGIYRDRGRSGTQREGKEVADLLVVFGNHVLIFQDKDCRFPDSGDLQVDWSRWYKKTVKAAAYQMSGAERHIRSSNGDLYIDHVCSQPLPISFPDMQKAVFHRIIVAHGASDRCKKEFGGGSGSLMIWPDIIDNQHFESQNPPVMPFAIGQVDSKQGYIHVLDDATLGIVLGTLDTITDFTDYLTRKEAFINSGKLTSATGEEDLLALYFTNINEQGHDFTLPPGITHLAVFEGMWQQFCDSPERRAQIAADEVSYCWDNLIEAFNKHIIQGTQYISNSPDYQRDVAVRFLAREPRTRRRILARHLLDLIRRTGASQRGAGIMAPSRPGDPYFVFLLLPRYASMPYEDYRRARSAHLQDYLMVVRLDYPDANDIVGIATESGLEECRSEDLAYFDARDWTTEDEDEAKRIQDEFNILKDIEPRRSVEQEFPVDSARDRRHHATAEHAPGKHPSTGKVGRNEQCPCGSGVKYKRCHGR